MSTRMNLVKLKIKVKHLATEPAIIRHEEKKLQGFSRADLQYHRIWDVRNEARATQLAIAFMKGKDINVIEPKIRDIRDHKHTVVLKRITAMVKKYGDKNIPESVLREWFYTRESV